MGQGVDEAQRQRELTKQALATNLDRLEARVRSELDWKARLRRDGPRIAAIGAAIVVAGAGMLLLRRRFKRRDGEEEEPAPTLEDVTAELREIRKQLEKHNGKTGSLVQKAVLRGVSAAGSAGGAALAKQMLKRQEATTTEGTGAARGG